MKIKTIELVTQHPVAHIVTASKEIVDCLLSMNTSNRRLRLSAVSRLVSEISGGRFMLTASGIGIGMDGVLCDGQHRLEAIKEAGYPPVQFVLVTGLDPSSQAVVDRHAKRSLADALTLVTGRTISTAMVAAANVLLAIRNSTHPSAAFASRSGSSAVSDGEVAETLVEWSDDLRAVLLASGGAPRAGTIAALAVYHRHDEAGATALASQIKTGLLLCEDDPAYRLRAALGTLKGGADGTFRAWSLTVSAVCAHSSGRQLKLLKQSDSWERSGFKPWKAGGTA